MNSMRLVQFGGEGNVLAYVNRICREEKHQSCQIARLSSPEIVTDCFHFKDFSQANHGYEPADVTFEAEVYKNETYIDILVRP